MKRVLLVLLVAVFAIPTFQGCKKYPEGPAISLASKKSRIVNTWKWEKAIDVLSGDDYTSDYIGYTLEMKKDNSFVLSGDGDVQYGAWDFSNNKEELMITWSGGDIEKWKILRLKSNELWINILTEDVEFHFKSN